MRKFLGFELGEHGGQVSASELPMKRLRRPFVTGLERQKAFGELRQRAEVVRGNHLSLHDREVDFDLVEPAGVNRCVHKSHRGPLRPKACGGFLASVRRAVVSHPENAASGTIGLCLHHLSHETVDSADGGLRLAPAEELRPMDVPRGQIGQRARAEILVFDARDTSRGWAKRGVLAPTRLDTWFLVRGHHKLIRAQSSTLPAARVQIEHTSGPLGEERVSRKDPAAMAPGLEGVHTEPAPECHAADLRDDTAGDDLTLEFGNREARQWYFEPRRDLTGEALNLDDDAGGKSGLDARRGAVRPARRGVQGRTYGAIC